MAAKISETERSCLTFADTLAIPADLMLRHGRRGFWTKEQVLFNQLCLRLGFHVFNDANSYNDQQQPLLTVDPKDVVYICCNVKQLMQMASFTAILNIEIPCNKKNITHRWIVDQESKMTPFMPIDYLMSCYSQRPSYDNNNLWVPDDIWEVQMNIQLSFFFEKIIIDPVDLSIKKPLTPMASGLNQEKVQFQLPPRRDDSNNTRYITIDRDLVKPQVSPFLAYQFQHNRIYHNPNIIRNEDDLIVLLRYLVHRCVPSSIEVTKSLINMASAFQMHRFLQICLNILYPIYMRNTRNMMYYMFITDEAFKSQTFPITCEMFDLLKHDATLELPSLAVTALSCLSCENEQQNEIRFGLLPSASSAFLLGDEILANILKEEN